MDFPKSLMIIELRHGAQSLSCISVGMNTSGTWTWIPVAGSSMVEYTRVGLAAQISS